MKKIIALLALFTSSFVMSTTTPVRAQYGIEIGPGGVQVAPRDRYEITMIVEIENIETSVGMTIEMPAQDAVAIDLLPMASIGHSRAV